MRVNLYLFLVLFAVVIADPLWKEWLTGDLTTTEGIMVMTSAVASQYNKAHRVWKSCRHHFGRSPVPEYNCATEVFDAIAKWGIGLAALGKVTGFWKRGYTDHGDHIDLAGTMLRSVNNYTVSYKRDVGSEINFDIDGVSFIYRPTNLTAIIELSAKVFVMGMSACNDTVPVMILEANDNGQWSVTPLNYNMLSKRDGVTEDVYFSDADSIIVECQYGAGLQETGEPDLYNYILGRGEAGLCDNQYYAFHGYIGSNSRMKCAAKVYAYDDTDVSHWREWNDVWRSF